MIANPSRRRLLAALIVSVAIPLGVSACSSSSTTGSTTTTTDAASGPNSACSLVTPAEIDATLGKQVGKPTAVNTVDSTACTYPSTDRSDKSNSVIIVFRGGVTTKVSAAEQAALAKLHGSTTDISGVGDSAFYYTVDTGGHTVTSLVTRVNEAQVSVTSTATLAQSEALAKQIFATFATDSTSTTQPAG